MLTQCLHNWTSCYHVIVIFAVPWQCQQGRQAVPCPWIYWSTPVHAHQNRQGGSPPQSLKTMRWLNGHLKSSLLALLGSAAILPTFREDRVENIRQLMLDELGEFGNNHFPNIVRRVRYAIDAQALWFVRSEVMTVLGAMYGETIALEKISRISQKFKGLVPKGLTSRTGSL